MADLVETMMYVGATPWHGKGNKLDRPPTSAEAIRQAGLDWSVEALPIYGQSVQYTEPHRLITGGGFEQIAEGQVVRRCSDGSVLGVVGPRWHPVQNVDAFRFFDPLVEEGRALYHTAGSLKDGKVVWILAQIGNTQTIVGDDGIGQFLLLSMGHDGTRAVQLSPTLIRVVCANTLGVADRQSEGEKTTIKVTHSRNAVHRLDEIRTFLDPFLADFEQTTEVFKLLARAQVQAGQAERYLQELIPDPEKEGVSNAFATRVRREIMAKFEGDLMGYEAIPAQFRRTWWTLYNAVTEYVDHDRGTDARRLESAWEGTGRALKDRALELIRV